MKDFSAPLDQGSHFTFSIFLLGNLGLFATRFSLAAHFVYYDFEQRRVHVSLSLFVCMCVCGGELGCSFHVWHYFCNLLLLILIKKN